MLQCLLSIHANCIDIRVGGASCHRDLFWSQPIPGFHNCPGQIQFKTTPNLEERTFSISINESESIYYHCNYTLNNTTIGQLQELEIEDSFIRFYLNHSTARANLFHKHQNKSYLYSSFNFTTNSYGLTVKTSNPVLIEEGANISIQFSINNITILPIISLEPVKAKTYSLALVVLLSDVAFVVVIYTIIERKKQGITAFEVAEVWRRPKYLSKELTVSTFGIASIFTLFFYYIIDNPLQNYCFKIINASVPSMCIAMYWRTRVSYIINEEISEIDFRTPAFLIYLFFVFPLSAANLFASLFCGSLRGLGICISIPTMTALSTLMTIISRAVGRLIYRIPGNFHIEKSLSFEPSQSHCTPNIADIISAMIFAITAFFFSRPLLNAIYDSAFNGLQMDRSAILDFAIQFGGVSAAVGALRAAYSHLAGGFSWLSGHIANALISAVAVGLPEVVRLFVDLLPRFHFEAAVFYAVGVLVAVGAAGAIASGLPMFVASAITVSVFH